MEGNETAENADALVGWTFGNEGDPLLNYFQTMSLNDFGDEGLEAETYHADQFEGSQYFTVDGGSPAHFDIAVTYDATITYVDGSTADVSITVFQDWMGNTYVAPESDANADMAALEAGPIQSLTLNSVDPSGSTNMSTDLQTWNYAVCFAAGTKILTPEGYAAVESLKRGDKVTTRDRGDQEILWVRRQLHEPREDAYPVRIVAGALGNGFPTRDLVVSRQHRILLRGAYLEKLAGVSEVLIPAINLTAIDGIYEDKSFDRIAYYHLLCAQHEILFANGVEVESLLLGDIAVENMGEEALESLSAVVPDWADMPTEPAATLVGEIDAKRLHDILACKKSSFVQSGDFNLPLG